MRNPASIVKRDVLKKWTWKYKIDTISLHKSIEE